MAVVELQVAYIVSLLKPSADRLAGLRGLEEALESHRKNDSAESASVTQSPPPPSPPSPGGRTDDEVANICLEAVRELLDNSTGKSDQAGVAPAPSDAGAGRLEEELVYLNKSLEELAVRLAFNGRSKAFPPLSSKCILNYPVSCFLFLS